MAEKGNIREHRDKVVPEPGNGERYSSALASPSDGDTVRVDGCEAPDGVHREYGIRKDATVVVGGRVLDSARHEAGNRGAGPYGVRGSPARAPHAPLSAGVHKEVGVAGGGPGQALVREATAAPVSVVFDNCGERTVLTGGHDEPRLDRMPAESRKFDVEDLESGEE